jgi:hypothetical protein
MLPDKPLKHFRITRYKYEVYAPIAVQTAIRPPAPINEEDFGITMDGVVVAKKGYKWDGASGPAIQRKENRRASLIHDILAEAMRLGLLPQHCFALANDELVRLCIEDGMNPWWAKNIYGLGVPDT